MRLVNFILPKEVNGAFVVANRDGIRFAGDVSSFIDRQIYIFGSYEEKLLDAFLSIIPSDRRGVLLDVGANAGTHSLSLARHFSDIHAFEPNPHLWPSFERNIELNGVENVTLHKVGLANKNAELPFHLTDNNNFGLGTFSQIEQYDRPLKEVFTSTVVIGDDYLSRNQVSSVNAVKIDVQGFEMEVLRGLTATLKREQPIIWFEVGGGTLTEMGNGDVIPELIPFPHELFRFVPGNSLFSNSVSLVAVSDGAIERGNYIARPI